MKIKVTRADLELIDKICERAMNTLTIDVNRMTLFMDISSAHEYNGGLRLQDFLDAPEFDFAHDVYGIVQHLNRMTAKLENCFLPRYSTKGDQNE